MQNALWFAALDFADVPALPKTVLSSTRNDTSFENLCSRLSEITNFKISQIAAALLGTGCGLLLGMRCRGHGISLSRQFESLCLMQAKRYVFEKACFSSIWNTCFWTRFCWPRTWPPPKNIKTQGFSTFFLATGFSSDHLTPLTALKNWKLEFCLIKR